MWSESMLAKLQIFQRLMLAIILPVILLIGLAGYDLSAKWQARAEMAKLEPLAQGVANLSRFIHSLQRERGASAAKGHSCVRKSATSASAPMRAASLR
jgi:hypothetical protein